MKMTLESIMAGLNLKISAFVVIDASYLRFSYHFLPRPESATFLLATVSVMHTRQSVIFVNGLAQSGVGKSRQCCFPHEVTGGTRYRTPVPG